MTTRQADSRWQWRDRCAVETHDGSATLRRQAIVQALVTAAIGVVVDLAFGHHTFAIILWSLAGAVFLVGLFVPVAYRPMRAFGQLLGRIVGGVLLYALLVPVYYVIFLPVSLWLRLRGRDPLHRAMRDGQWTCWIRRRAETPRADYRRQFLVEDREARAQLRPVSGNDDSEAPA